MAGLLQFSVLSALLCLRLTRGNDCITNQNDTGAINIRKLEEAINDAACRLVRDITYSDYDVTDEEEFDFIVVGAGSAGCVVANRLSENSDWKVLLLEAGGDPQIFSEIPGLLNTGINSDLDWKFQTEPQPTSCQGMASGSCLWSAGKVLGGSSTINGMLYVRGNPKDYDHWENLGNPGWSYKYMLHYFKKSEDLRSLEVAQNENTRQYHGRGGYLKIESFRSNIDFYKDLFSRGLSELGLGSYTDVNANHHEGFFSIQGTLNYSRRCSTAKAFIHNFQSRPNLKVSKDSLVVKILIDESHTAQGVQFTKGGTLITTKAKKEVILSAGTVNSPKLLMLSGIGPQKHLREHGINVTSNLKVGFNLQDQVVVTGFIVSFDLETKPSDIIDETFQFLINSKGDLAGVNLISINAFIDTIHAAYPNIQFIFQYFDKNSTNKIAQVYGGYNEDIVKELQNINSRKFIMIFTPTLLRPASRGRIKLRSSDPQDDPLIHTGYFTQDCDVFEMLDAIKFANALAQTEAMKRLGAKVERLDIPACKSYQFQSELYWRCIIAYMSSTSYHQVGSCSMGPAENRISVVDPHLKVHGVTSLRVIDASIMPTVTSGNTNAPVIAIAEKGSDLIKQCWRGE